MYSGTKVESIMVSIFPKPICNLPEVDIAFESVTAYVFQGKNEQIVFMEFKKDTDFAKVIAWKNDTVMQSNQVIRTEF